MSNSHRTHHFTFRGVKALKGSHPEVRRIKRKQDAPSLHGTKVWRSSFALIDYLRANPLPKGAKVIDVGCGWGLTGIWSAKTFGAKVLAVDADPAVAPYLNLQARLNKTQVTFKVKRFEQLRGTDFAGVHTVLGTDICFWDEMIKPLFQMLKRAKKAGVKRSIIADPGRPTFWQLAQQAEQKLDAEVVMQRVSRPKPTEKPLLIVAQ